MTSDRLSDADVSEQPQSTLQDALVEGRAAGPVAGPAFGPEGGLQSTRPTAAAGCPSSLGDLARRVSRRTVDLVAIAIVLAASLSLGRQVIQWWGVDPEPPRLAAPMDSLAGEELPVTLEFGDHPLRLTRQMFTGERQAGLLILLQASRVLLESAQQDAASTFARSSTPAEEQLLARTADLKPIEEVPGRWQIYQVDLPFVLILGVGVRSAAESGSPGTAGSSESPESSQTAGATAAATSVATPAPQRYLVSWGIMLPHGENAWTLYTFEIKPGDEAGGAGSVADVPLPPSSRRLLSLADRHGGRFVGVAGDGTPAEWQRFFDGFFQSQGWEAAGGWHVGDGHWSARFQRKGSSNSASVDIQFGNDERGGTSGVVCLTPGEP